MRSHRVLGREPHRRRPIGRRSRLWVSVEGLMKPLLGAYGFRLSGVEAATELLARAEPEWPELEVVAVTDGTPPPPHDRVSEDRAELILRSGGWVEVDRAASRAIYHLHHRVRDGDLLHPYLAPVAA